MTDKEEHKKLVDGAGMDGSVLDAVEKLAGSAALDAAESATTQVKDAQQEVTGVPHQAMSTPLQSKSAPRQKTRQIKVGDVPIGGGAPVVVQSMTNVAMCEDGDIGVGVGTASSAKKNDGATNEASRAQASEQQSAQHMQSEPVLDVQGNIEQIERLKSAGCELVRVAIPHKASLPFFGEIVKRSSLPVIADVHFDHEIAIEAARLGAAALRINPGNIGSMQKVDSVIDAAKAVGIPIRIGVNAGSLENVLAKRTDLTLAQKLVCSACGFVEHFEQRNFYDVVVSAKAHDVMTCVEAYKQLSVELPHVPLHIGITEAGTALDGSVKSGIGCGILLSLGIGDTMRVSLTADPVQEIEVAYLILAACGVRYVKPELISCPTCSRCQVNLIEIARQVKQCLSSIKKPIKVAVMGCAVNGPGEAADADVGVACGKKEGLLFAYGKPLYKVKQEQIVSELMRLVDEFEELSGS